MQGPQREEIEPGRLRIYAVTWNVSGMTEPAGVEELLTKNVSFGECDIYVVGLQECAVPMSKWKSHLERAMRPLGFSIVASVQLDPGGWLMMILLMPDALHPLVEDVKLDSVSTGVAKVMGNKGGVGVSFFYAGISLLFVCCHLAAHQENVEERNNDFKRITSSLFAKEGGRAGKRSAKVSPASVDRDASEEHHATIWLGDLNYRVEGSRDAINRVLEQEMLEVLHENDQLRKEVKRGNAFPGFREVTPSFLPTYKVMPRTGEYDMSGKRRIPSWTDRILFKAEPMNGEGKVDVGGLHYDSIPSLLFSDHVPVTAVVEMRLSAGWRSPTVASPSNSNRSGKSWCSIQ